MEEGNGRNLLNMRVPLPAVIAWIVGICGFFGLGVAVLAWGWISSRVTDLETGVSTPMAETTKLRFHQMERDIERLERTIEECLE